MNQRREVTKRKAAVVKDVIDLCIEAKKPIDSSLWNNLFQAMGLPKISSTTAAKLRAKKGVGRPHASPTKNPQKVLKGIVTKINSNDPLSADEKKMVSNILSILDQGTPKPTAQA